MAVQFLEIMFIVFMNILVQNLNIIIPVGSALFVPKSYSMSKFVHDNAKCVATETQRQLLFTATSSNEGTTPEENTEM
jgi:hypothetical protein